MVTFEWFREAAAPRLHAPRGRLSLGSLDVRLTSSAILYRYFTVTLPFASPRARSFTVTSPLRYRSPHLERDRRLREGLRRGRRAVGGRRRAERLERVQLDLEGRSDRRIVGSRPRRCCGWIASASQVERRTECVPSSIVERRTNESNRIGIVVVNVRTVAFDDADDRSTRTTPCCIVVQAMTLGPRRGDGSVSRRRRARRVDGSRRREAAWHDRRDATPPRRAAAEDVDSMARPTA